MSNMENMLKLVQQLKEETKTKEANIEIKSDIKPDIKPNLDPIEQAKLIMNKTMEDIRNKDIKPELTSFQKIKEERGQEAKANHEARLQWEQEHTVFKRKQAGVCGLFNKKPAYIKEYLFMSSGWKPTPTSDIIKISSLGCKVYGYLEFKAGINQNYACVSLRNIAKNLNSTKPSIKRAIRELIDAKLIQIMPGTGSGKASNKYIFLKNNLPEDYRNS